MIYTNPRDDEELYWSWLRWSEAMDERDAYIREQNAWNYARSLEAQIKRLNAKIEDSRKAIDIYENHIAEVNEYIIKSKSDAQNYKERIATLERTVEDLQQKLGEMTAVALEYANESVDQNASKLTLMELLKKHADPSTVENVMKAFLGDAFVPVFKEKRQEVLMGELFDYYDVISLTRQNKGIICKSREYPKSAEVEREIQKDSVRNENYDGHFMIGDPKLR